MGAEIIVTGIAATISVTTRYWILATGLKGLIKYV